MCNTSDSTSSFNGQPGDPDLNLIVGPWKRTFDRAALEFQIWVTDTQTHLLIFKYVFASEEYNEWVYTPYEDLPGIFISPAPGPFARPNGNCARVPLFGGGIPWLDLTIDTVNGGNPFGFGAANPFHYVNNGCGDGGLPPRPCGAPERETELDGLTEHNRADPFPLVFRSVPALLVPGITYDVKLVVADTSDAIYDSDLFIKGAVYSAWGYCCVCAGDCTCVDGTSQDECETELGGTWSEGYWCGEGPCGVGRRQREGGTAES